MNAEEIKKVIFTQLKKIAPDTEPEKLAPTDVIRQALDIDSFDFLQFIVAIDKELGMNIPESDYGKIATLEKLITYITENKKVKLV